METVQKPQPLKHSGLGVASFILGVSLLLLTVFAFGLAGYFEATTPGGMQETDAAAMLIGLLLLFCWAGQLVGVGLGIAGCCQRERRKIFAILGLTFSAMMLLLSLFFVMLGLAAG
jgi:hypothetical protein